jgi:hypothetical protein
VVVERIEADNPAIVCQWARGPGNRATVRVHVDANKVSGERVEGTVTIHVASPAAEKITVPVTCILEGKNP